MGNSVFTTQFLFFDEKIYTAIWLRIPLEGFQFKKKHRRLMRKVEQNFRVEIKQATFDISKEVLFEKYKKHFKGNLYSTVNMYMLDDAPYNAFNTLECCVYDGNELIAFSYFDKGVKSIASILAAYHQDYAGYSLGIYTMLAEVKYAMAHNFEFYYPGYFVPGFKRFDYKYSLGGSEFYYFPSKNWVDFGEFKESYNISNVLKDKVKTVLQAYHHAGIHSFIFLYRNFEIGDYEESYGKVFLHPLMVISSVKNRFLQKELLLITEYHLFSQNYRVVQIVYPEGFNIFRNNNVIRDITVLVIENFLECDRVCFESRNLDEVVAFLNVFSKSFKNRKA